VQSKRGSGVNVTEEQLFEHERFMPLAGWSSRHLLPTERNRYSRQEDGMHSTNTFPQIRLPEGKVASCQEVLVEIFSVLNMCDVSQVCV